MCVCSQILISREVQHSGKGQQGPLCVLIGTEEKVRDKPVDNWLELTGGTLCMTVNAVVVRSLAVQKEIPSQNVKHGIKRTKVLTRHINYYSATVQFTFYNL